MNGLKKNILKKSRCVIFGAAKIQNYEQIKKNLLPDDFFVFCDGGLVHSKELKIEPDLIVGDFDSFEKPDTNSETIVLPCEKDDTDSFFAVKEAFGRGFRNFMLAGMTGGRFDHSMVNVSALIWLFERKCSAFVLDDFSKMQIVGKNPVFVNKNCRYFSIIPVCGKVKGLNILGAKYPLKNGKVSPEYIYTTSNEVLPEQTAQVSVKKGFVLLVEIFPE